MDEGLISIIRNGSRRLRPVPSGVHSRGSLPRAPRAVLFDVYGTLFQRLGREPPRGEQQVRKLIRNHGLSASPEALHAALAAVIAREHTRLKEKGILHPEVRIERIWRTLFPSLPGSELRRAIVQYELAVHSCWPMPGSRRLIAALVRLGLPLGIVSNAQFYTPLFFAALLGGRPEELGFSPELCFYSWVRGNAKPSQEMFEEAAAVFHARGIPPRDVLMAGNDPVDDIDAAKRVGFMTVQVSADGRSLPDGALRQTAAAPDAVVCKLADLTRLLEAAGRPARGV